MPKILRSSVWGSLFFALFLVSGQAEAISFSLPSGMDWKTVTSGQLAQAVYDSVKDRPTEAVALAVSAFRKAAESGRWAAASDDGVPAGQDPDPETQSLQEIASLISAAALGASPDMASDIVAAVSAELARLLRDISGAAGDTGGFFGDVSGGAVPFPSGGGGGGGGGGGFIYSE